MRFGALHDWTTDIGAARALQERLRDAVVLRPLARSPRLIAGADIATRSDSKGATQLFAAVVLWSARERRVVETRTRTGEAAFPYVPGFLSFREAPLLLETFASLRREPDCVMLDGQGLAHPRRFGLACHVGLWLGVPTIGCAKSLLVGKSREPSSRRGGARGLFDDGERIGTVLRTRDGVRPVYVSPGHLIDHAGAARVVLACGAGFRLPEPTRLADALTKRIRAASSSTGSRGYGE